MGQKGLAAVATTMPLGCSGIKSNLKKFGLATNDPGTVLRILQWQQEINGETGKINAFKAKVGSLLAFQAFLMTREGSAMVTVLHSVANYFAINAATLRHQGRYIGFVGDRLLTQEPGPVLIPALTSWEWVKKTVGGGGGGDNMCRAYNSGSKYGKSWVLAVDGSEVKKYVPPLLAIPPLFLKMIQENNKALMPHKVWTLVANFAATPGLQQDIVN
jgi:hypothetical protein